MKKALIIVDVQNDFLPGGALGITGGDLILPQINGLQKLPFDRIVATKDWHPKDHASFKVWPVHCVQNTPGAEFSPKLHTDRIQKVFYKGTDPNIDSYSTFFDNAHQHHTLLDAYLKEQHILEVWLAGLATDYCVKYSALDALDLGYTVYVVLDACKAIDDEASAVKEMSAKGAKIVSSREVPTFFTI